MENTAHLQAFLDDEWRDAGTVQLLSPADQGWEARTTVAYDLAYAITHDGRRDAAAVSASLPVSLESTMGKTWPAFLMDLLPQGYGRQELLRQLGLPETAAASADWRLLVAGAGNPVGNLRVREAAERLSGHTVHDRQGFTEAEVMERGEAFTAHLSTHGLFVAGSSGVQGEWPKILLTEGRDGLFYLDHALPDGDAVSHWLVKFARGPNAALATILRLEAPYMQLAKHLGLDVRGRMRGNARALFIPRFDREVIDGRVHRYAQESLASLCGLAGFGVAPSHNEACRRLARTCTNPVRDIVEYVRRDVANVALGNKDNHARNTAIQRREYGFIGLTPLFDFVPMMLHPDGIARRMRWERDDEGSPRWASVVEQVADATAIDVAMLRGALREMAPLFRDIRKVALRIGVDVSVMDTQRLTIEDIVTQLEAL